MTAITPLDCCCATWMPLRHLCLNSDTLWHTCHYAIRIWHPSSGGCLLHVTCNTKLYASAYAGKSILKPNLDCNYAIAIDLAQNGILFGAKSIEKEYNQSGKNTLLLHKVCSKNRNLDSLKKFRIDTFLSDKIGPRRCKLRRLLFLDQHDNSQINLLVLHYTQWNRSWIWLVLTKFELKLPFSDRFSTKRNSAWC